MPGRFARCHLEPILVEAMPGLSNPNKGGRGAGVNSLGESLGLTGSQWSAANHGLISADPGRPNPRQLLPCANNPICGCRLEWRCGRQPDRPTTKMVICAHITSATLPPSFPALSPAWGTDHHPLILHTPAFYHR